MTKQRKYKKQDFFKAMAFAAPWLVGFFVLTLYPIIQTFIFSFNKVNFTNEKVVTVSLGLANYKKAFTDSEFIEVLIEYVTEIVIYVPVIIVVSLIIAFLLNTKIKGTGIFRTIFFLPVIITSGPVIKQFIEQGVAEFAGLKDLIDFNVLSDSLPAFLVSALQFLTESFIMILWFAGIQILVFLTALHKLDKNMYEAANIDGASKWESFWKITLPALNSMIVINVVFTLVMQSIFTLNPVIDKIQKDIFVAEEGYGYGYASSLAWIYFVILAILLIAFVLLFKARKKRRLS